MSIKNAVTFRIILDIAVFLLVMHGYWYAAFVLVCIAFAVFPLFVESIFFGVMHDALFGLREGLLFHTYTGTIVTVFLFLFAVLFRKLVRK